MLSLRFLNRCKSLPTLITRSCKIQTDLFKINKFQQPLESTNIIFVRNYAKGKDKKKEKGKNATKVQINENQLREIINLDSLNTQLDKTLETMKDEFVKNLSLRSTTGSIETLKIVIDGKDHELQEIAQIVRKNPKTIVINMISFPQVIPTVLTALEKSGMNLNPQQDGTTIFIPVPKVTKEHRENLSKNAKVLFLKCKDGIKDVQNNQIKKLKRMTEISTDENHSIQSQVTAIADKYIVQAEKLLEAKQSELIGGN